MKRPNEGRSLCLSFMFGFNVRQLAASQADDEDKFGCKRGKNRKKFGHKIKETLKVFASSYRGREIK